MRGPATRRTLDLIVGAAALVLVADGAFAQFGGPGGPGGPGGGRGGRAGGTPITPEAVSLPTSWEAVTGPGAMFNSAPEQPDTATSAAACRKSAKTPADRRTCDQEAKAARVKHDSVAKETYRLAAKAFEAGLARSPYSRDGLYNSLSTYYLLGDTAKIVPTARRLVAVPIPNLLRAHDCAHDARRLARRSPHRVVPGTQLSQLLAAVAREQGVDARDDPPHAVVVAVAVRAPSLDLVEDHDRIHPPPPRGIHEDGGRLRSGGKSSRRGVGACCCCGSLDDERTRCMPRTSAAHIA